jgi:DNA-binding MarR family transcriptional regulator
MYSFLLCLEKHPGISQDFLVSYFSIDKGTVARLCQKLEELGLIRRLVSDGDRRVYELVLADQGLDMLKIIHQHLNDWSDRMLAGFNPTDRQTAFNLLQRMADNIT